MGRNSWIVFGMTAIVIISIVLVALLILVPQGELTTIDIYDDYGSFDESDYTYTQSKDISEEGMKETYSVTSEDINEGKASKLYNQGNTNPFADVSAGSSGSSSNGSGTNSGTTSSSNGNTTTVTPYSAEDK